MDDPEEKPKASSLSIKEMWEDAERRFLEDTGTELRTKGPVTLTECKAQIAKLQQPAGVEPGPVDKSRGEKVKEFGLAVLPFLKTLAGLAGQVSEGAFPASGLVFSAVSFLLDIPPDLHDFHGAVEGLFETLGTGLTQFVMYENLKLEQFNELEEGLKQAIHRLMISFVRICGLSIKFRKTGRWKKFKGDTRRILLQDDSGVKEEVERFKTLTEDHHNIQSTQTLKAVLDIKDSADKRKADETKNQNIELIIKKLELDDNPAIKSSKDMCEKLWRDRLEGTVSWVDNPDQEPHFHRWAERHDTNAKPLFTVTGNSNTGKSVIAASVVYHLRSLYESPARKLERTIVASYFFLSISGKNDTDRQPVHTALKCIALQIAEADPQYAATIARACHTKPDLKHFLKNATCRDLWDFLLLGAPTGKTVYYFVFDGISSLPDEPEYQKSKSEFLNAIRRLRANTSRGVRVLLSTRTSRLEPAPLFDGTICWNLPVGETGTKDITLYIDRDLQNHDMLQGGDEYRTEKRNMVRNRLSGELGGNYYKVITALDKIKNIIRKTGKWDDILNVLDEANEDEQAISQRAIRELEESLEATEIEELNELLTWVGYGCSGQMTVPLLDTALMLRFKTPSLLSLEKKLRGKYSRLFQFSGDWHVLIADGMLDLVHQERTSQQGQEDEAKFSLTITITKANLSSVQQFLWSLSMKASQDSFGFQQLEDGSKFKGSIRVNRFDSYMTILRRTFTLLNDEPRPETRDIISRLLSYLPQHLDDCHFYFTTSEKQEVGRGLYSIFRKGSQIIQRHWASTDDLWWHWNKDELAVYLQWLSEPEVIAGLGWLDQQWLHEVSSSINPYRALLMNIMTSVAEILFRGQQWHVGRPFRFIEAFLFDLSIDSPPLETLGTTGPPTIVKNEAVFKRGGTDKESEDLIHRLKAEYGSDIVQILAAWCREILHFHEPDVLWKLRLAEVYDHRGMFEEAIGLLRPLTERNDPGPESLEDLAKALGHGLLHDATQLVEACQTMRRALALLEKEDRPENQRIVANYLLLSEWYEWLEDIPASISCLQKVLDLDSSSDVAYYRLLCAWLEKSGDDEEGIRFLHKMVETKGVDGEQSRYGSMMHNLIFRAKMLSDMDEAFTRLFSLMSARPELARITLEELDRAIEWARARKVPFHLGPLLFFRGLATSPYHYNIPDPAPEKTTLDYWKECIIIEDGITALSARLRDRVSSMISAHRFEQLMAARNEPNPSSFQMEHLDALLRTTKKDRDTDLSPAKSYLASYYTAINKPKEARSVIRECINSAFEMLSDQDDDNDLNGYTYLGFILMHCGDSRNAFTAFSLLLPPLFGTNVLEWMLEDIQTEPERTIMLDLVKKVNDRRDLTDLHSQTAFIYELIDAYHRNPTPASGSTTPVATPDGTNNNTTTRAISTTTTALSPPPASSPAPAPISSPILTPTTRIPSPLPQHLAQSRAAYQKIRSHLVQYQRTKHVLPYPLICTACGKYMYLFSSHSAGSDAAATPTPTPSLCKCCYNVGFCPDCTAQLRERSSSSSPASSRRLAKRKVDSFTCSREHEMLRMPRFDKKKYLEALRGRVWISKAALEGGGGNGEEEEVVVGGKLVGIKDWLDGLKREWGYVDNSVNLKEVQVEGDGVKVGDGREGNLDGGVEDRGIGELTLAGDTA